MKTLKPAFGPLLLGIAMLTSCNDGGDPIADCLPPVGFRMAYFDHTGLLDDVPGGYEAMRFYGVRRDANDREGTVMAIAVDRDGSELPDVQGNKIYRMYSNVNGVDISIEKVNAQGACERLFHMIYSGKASCISEMSRSQIDRLMIGGAMKVEPVLRNDVYTMRFIPIAIKNGQMIEGSAVEVCSRPCPRDCGRYDRYVCM
jgi:hypothetical protein